MITNPTNEHREQARERITDDQITEQVADMQARLHTCAQNGQAYRVKWHEVKSIIGTIQTLQQQLAEEKKWHGDHEEREAACCPEDVPCDEYIRSLERSLSSRDTEIREVLEGLRFRHGCWCELPPNVSSPHHTNECDDTRALWSKLQPKESNDA